MREEQPTNDEFETSMTTLLHQSEEKRRGSGSKPNIKGFGLSVCLVRLYTKRNASGKSCSSFIRMALPFRLRESILLICANSRELNNKRPLIFKFQPPRFRFLFWNDVWLEDQTTNGQASFNTNGRLTLERTHISRGLTPKLLDSHVPTRFIRSANSHPEACQYLWIEVTSERHNYGHEVR